MKILHLEDNPNDAELVRILLASEWPDIAITLVNSRDAFVAALKRGGHEAIISDFRLPGFDGHESLELARKLRPDLPFIVLSGTVGEEVAVKIMRAGATDYLLKDRMQRLPFALRQAIEEGEQRQRRRHTEERMREQAELLDKARDGIVVTDMDDRILFWNQGAERILGWPSAEAVGKESFELFGHAFDPEILKERNHGDECEEWNGEFQLEDRKGQSLFVEVRVTLIRGKAGRPKSRLKIITDISEKKRLEEQFLRTQRMENLGMLAAGIAHDLNNVLAPLLLGAPLLRSRATDSSDLQMLEMMERSAVRGSALVKQILSFAHGTSADRTLVQVRHVLREIADLVCQTFPKAIELQEEVSRDLWAVHGNPTQLYQVLLNLCINARDAMPQGGTLRIRAENQVRGEPEAGAAADVPAGNVILLEVTDTGTGIPPDVLARMWDPFFTTKGAGKGTGLGLATVRGIAASYGGFVAVKSEVGRGTTFQVFLPAADSAGATGVAQGGPDRLLTRGNGELVLVVDDEESISDLIQVFLTRYGCRVLVARDGNDAIAHFTPRAAEIALVITDVDMPAMGGGDLARALLRINPLAKVIFMTGDDRSVPQGSASVATHVLKKPFAGDELLACVHAALNRPQSGEPIRTAPDHRSV